jgi:quercetin 2,3-dioxygenase
MTAERKIEGIYRGAPFHWVGDGFRVTNYFPSGNRFGARVSPFILMDYHPPYRYPPTESIRRGVGPHPHRGFETVTLAFEGKVAHHDNAGHAGVIVPGDVQWMTAARGVLHKEYHEREFARTGGTFHMMQLWVNLPKAHKMDAPRYQALPARRVGQVELADGGGYVRVIAGEYQGVRGPALTFTPIDLFDLRLDRGQARFEFASRQNALLLVMRGELEVNNLTVRALDLVLFENEGQDIKVRASQSAHALVLSGEPIDEPIVQRGPFVMNTEQEISQAIDDYNSGRFGYLAD